MPNIILHGTPLPQILQSLIHQPLVIIGQECGMEMLLHLFPCRNLLFSQPISSKLKLLSPCSCSTSKPCSYQWDFYILRNPFKLHNFFSSTQPINEFFWLKTTIKFRYLSMHTWLPHSFVVLPPIIFIMNTSPTSLLGHLSKIITPRPLSCESYGFWLCWFCVAKMPKTVALKLPSAAPITSWDHDHRPLL